MFRTPYDSRGLLPAALLGLALAAVGCKPEPVHTSPTTTPVTLPATQPATEPTSKPAAAKYFDVLRAAYPAFPATQPLAIPLALSEAAHIILKEPVFLDEQGHLWITRDDGADAETDTRHATTTVDSEHVVRETVLFVWWLPDRSQNFSPRVITVSETGATELIVPSRRLPMGNRDDYQWRRARSWVDGQAQRLIVPTARGVSVFTFGSDREPIVEAHQSLDRIAAPSTVPATNPTSTPAMVPAADQERSNSATGPLFLFDPAGFIAWIPATKVSAGSPGAARYLNGSWIALTPDAGWTDRLLHLIPLRDGSVTQLLQKPIADGGGVKIGLVSVDAPRVDRKVIMDLVDSLNDRDKDVRDLSYARLTEYGPGIWPILKEIPADDLPPEARSRLNRLLKSQVTPMLGGMALQGDQLKLVARLRDGGVVFHTEQGINVPNPAADEPISHAPAWIAARPGRAVEMLGGPLVFQADPKQTRFDVIQGQWIVTFDDEGPQLFLGNSFRKLLRKDVRAFTDVVGIDRRGRWIFRKPTTRDTSASGVETLIIDPTLPDFVPKLPVWLFANANEAGWTREGWPAVRLDQSRTKLIADQWLNMAETEEFITVVEPEPVKAPDPSSTSQSPPRTLPTTRPATAPATQSATTQPTTRPIVTPERIAELGRLLTTDPSGNRYFGGVDDIVRIDREDVETRWPLPEHSRGDSVAEAPPTLIVAGDYRLFLFNRTGRVLRIKHTPEASEPFLLEGTFTQNIPEDERPHRIWLDPAGRIIMALDKKLAILFPQGFMPTPIRRMMDVNADDE